MIKQITVALLCICISNSYAQRNDHEFKRYKQEINFGFVKPLKNTAGFSFSTEPKFAVLDKLAIGLRLEGSFWFDTYNTGLQSIDATELVTFSIVPTLDYYFTKKLFRPFIGIGYGVYAYPLANNSYTYNRALDLTFDNNTGLLLRGGFEVGHFRLGINYNHVNRKATTISLPTTSYKEDWSYVDVKIGVILGGKKKY